MRLRLRVVGDVGNVADADEPGIHAGLLDDVELLERARSAALVRRVREERQARPQVHLAARAQHLALVRMHRQRRADLAERAPALRCRITDEAVRDLVFRLPGDLRRIVRLRPVSVGEDDVHARALGHDPDFLDVLAEVFRSGVDDAAHAIFGSRFQFLDHQIDVGSERRTGGRVLRRGNPRCRRVRERQVLVKQRGAPGQRFRRHVFQNGANDRTLGKAHPAATLRCRSRICVQSREEPGARADPKQSNCFATAQS